MTYLKTGTAVALIGTLALVGCSQRAPAPAADLPAITDSAAVDAYAISILDGLQPQSIASSVEFCGYIIQLPDGQLASSRIYRGGEAFCDLPSPGPNTIASYHTHGGFSAEYDNEVPSVDDVQSDFEAGIDGYVGTPGGRVWLIDYDQQIARQICDTVCIASDPDDDPRAAGFVPQSFTLPELRARFE